MCLFALIVKILDLLFTCEFSFFFTFFNFFFKIVDLFDLIVKIWDLLFMREFSKCLNLFKILDLFQNCVPFHANCQNFGLFTREFTNFLSFFNFFFKIVDLLALIVKIFNLIFMCELSKCLTLFKIIYLFQNCRPFRIKCQNFGLFLPFSIFFDHTFFDHTKVNFKHLLLKDLLAGFSQKS